MFFAPTAVNDLPRLGLEPRAYFFSRWHIALPLSLSLSLSFFPLLLLALSSLLSVIFSKLPACRSAAWPDAAARCGRALSHTEISKSGLDIAQSLININLLSQLLSCLR